MDKFVRDTFGKSISLNNFNRMTECSQHHLSGNRHHLVVRKVTSSLRAILRLGPSDYDMPTTHNDVAAKTEENE